MTAPARHQSRRQSLVLAAALGALTILVFAPVTHFAFLSWDDPSYVTENPRVLAGLTPAGFVWAFTTGAAANWHPLTWLSHMLDVQLFGLSAGRHHAINLALHVVNVLQFFFLLLAMTSGASSDRTDRAGGRTATRAVWPTAVWPSAFAAALFAIHPLHVESVAWISERKDVLSTCLWLLTMRCYVSWTRRPANRWRYAAMLVSFALGLMAKPMLVTLPLVLLLMDQWPLGRWQPGDRRWRLADRVREKLPLFALAAASAVVTFAVQRAGGAVGGVTQLSWTFRVTNALAAYAEYLGRTLWPRHLSAFYPYPSAPPFGLAIVGALILVAVSIWTTRARRRHGYLFAGWFWFVVTIVPVVGLVQVGDQATADRYTYVPLIGIFIMVAWGVRDLAARWKLPAIVRGAAGLIVVGALSVTARAQVDTWRDNAVLWTHALEVTERNYRAHLGVADALVDAGDPVKAIPEYRAALALVPRAAAIHNSLGLALTATGDFAGAAEEYRAAVRWDPRHADAHDNLGAMLARTHHLDEAIGEYRQAIAIDPALALAHNNLCVAWAAQGHVAEAIPECRAALTLRPREAQWHYQTGLMLASLGRVAEATAELRQTLAIDPNHVLARQALDRLSK